MTIQKFNFNMVSLNRLPILYDSHKVITFEYAFFHHLPVYHVFAGRTP